MICDFKKGAGGKGRSRAAYLSSGLAVCQLSHATALSYSNQHMPLQLWANLHAKLLNPPPRTPQGRRSAPPAPQPLRARHASASGRGARRRVPGQRQHPRSHRRAWGQRGSRSPGSAAPCLPSPLFPSPPARPGTARPGPEEQVKGRAAEGQPRTHTSVGTIDLIKILCTLGYT